MVSMLKKPWGYEELLEYNKNYSLKKLFMKADNCCSLQYHNFKHETIYVLSGKLKIITKLSKIDNSIIENILAEGNYMVIEPGLIHRMCGITDCIYLEASTSQLDDVVRLEDDYGRV